jgi:hypothetical protein
MNSPRTDQPPRRRGRAPLRTLVTAALVGGLALGLPASTGADTPSSIEAEVTGFDNAGRPDRLAVEAAVVAAGARVKLYGIARGATLRERTLVGTGELSRYGRARFVVPDANGRQETRYVARVGRTDASASVLTAVHRVR